MLSNVVQNCHSVVLRCLKLFQSVQDCVGLSELVRISLSPFHIWNKSTFEHDQRNWKKKLLCPGIEPGARACSRTVVLTIWYEWEARILPLNQHSLVILRPMQVMLV
jgi:hypothetical protein